MASKTVTRKFADNTTCEFVRPKQGRRQSPQELKRDFLIQVLTTQGQGGEFENMRRKFSMSKSAFGNLVVSYGLQALAIKLIE